MNITQYFLFFLLICGTQNTIQCMEQQNPWHFLAADTKNIVAVAQGVIDNIPQDVIDKQKVLQELEHAMNMYVATLSPELQQALNWPEQFTLLKKRLESFNVLLKKVKDIKVYLKKWLDTEDIYHEFEYAALGFKPVSIIDGIHEIESNEVAYLAQTIASAFSEKTIFFGFSASGNDKFNWWIYNQCPIFPFKFVYQCYQDLKLNKKFEQEIIDNTVNLNEWSFKLFINKFIPIPPPLKALKREELGPDMSALLYGFQPKVFDKRTTKKIPFFQLYIEALENNKDLFRLTMIPGINDTADTSAYSILYGMAVEYAFCFMFHTKRYMQKVAERIFDALDKYVILNKIKAQAFIQKYFTSTSITPDNFANKFKAKAITYKEKITFMANFLAEYK